MSTITYYIIACVIALPAIHIYTPETPFDIRELWQDGTIIVSEPGQEPIELEARIRGRGHSTWFSGPDKRPLRFRLAEPSTVLASENEAINWILLADNFDRSLMRNYFTLTLANRLDGLSFTPIPQHLQLYVNGEYMGVYLLTDERDNDQGRMSLEWNSDPALSCFLVELDSTGEGFVVHGLQYDFRYPSGRRLTQDHIDYAQAHVQRVSNAIRSQDFDEISRLIDLPSFIDFYIVQELTANIDVHLRSVFMHISDNGNGRRLFKGPVWDFDLALGNKTGQTLGHSPEHLYAGVVNYWYRYLLGVPEFSEAVTLRWNEIVNVEIADSIIHISRKALRYQADFERNFERHPILGVDVYLIGLRKRFGK